jgi:hypothetical protein
MEGKYCLLNFVLLISIFGVLAITAESKQPKRLIIFREMKNE